MKEWFNGCGKLGVTVVGSLQDDMIKEGNVACVHLLCICAGNQLLKGLYPLVDLIPPPLQDLRRNLLKYFY